MSTIAGSVPAARSVPAGRGWDWIAESWRLTAGHRFLFVALVVAVIVVAALASAVPVVGGLVAALVLPIFTAGLIHGCDALHRGERLTLDHLFIGFEREPRKLLALGAVCAVANFVLTVIGDLIADPRELDALLQMIVAAALGGTALDPLVVYDILLHLLLAMLVVLALSLPLVMAMWFAVPLVTLRGAGVPSSLRASFTACADNTLPFLAWSVPPLLLTIVLVAPLSAAIATRSVVLGLLAFPALLLDFGIIATLTFASMYTSYRDVFAFGG